MADSKCLFCEVCFSKPAFLVPLQHTLEKLTGTSKDKTKGKAEIKHDEEEAKNAFFKVINSFLNAEGGSILIHSDGDANVDLFDQKVDDKLLTLITDDALYQDVFERSFLDDNHLYYRVKPRSGQQPFSTLVCNTKFSVDKGLSNPTYGQMRDLIKPLTEEGEKSTVRFEAYRGTAILGKGQPAKPKDPQTQGQSSDNSMESESIPFRENMCTQAKAYDSQKDLEELGSEQLKLFISVLSKIRGGGSIFLGVKEEETNVMVAGGLIVECLHTNGITQHEIQENLHERIRTEFMHIGRRVTDKHWNLNSLHSLEVHAVPLEEVQPAVLKVLHHQSQGSKNRTETSSRPLRENTCIMNRGLTSWRDVMFNIQEQIQRHSKTRKRKIESVGANVTDTTLPFLQLFKGLKDGTALEEGIMSGIIHDGNIPTTVDEKYPVVGVIKKKLDTFKREDYIKDTTLIGADPLRPDYPLVHKYWTTGETHGRQFCPQFQDEGHTSKTLREYAKDSDLCVWISEALPEYFDLPVATKPLEDVVQAFLAGVNLPIILLTVCQDVEKAREYANETASALKWRVLDFCHLDFLLLPCVVPNNFDLKDLEDEIKKQQQKLSWCHGGPTCLDENTFPTMKAATNALAGSTWVPSLLEDNGPEEMKTLVMEEEWRDLMLRRIDELSEEAAQSGHPLKLKLDPGIPFKEKVAEIEAMKRMSVRNSVTVVITTPDSKLDACIWRLKQEVVDRYDVKLQIEVTTEVQEGSLQETTRAGGQTSDEAASDQTPIPSVAMSRIQGSKSLVLTNRG